MVALDDEMAKALLLFSSADFQLSGPVVDLSLYECSTRRKIPVRALIQPINIELQQPPGNVSLCFFFSVVLQQVDSVCTKSLHRETTTLP